MFIEGNQIHNFMSSSGSGTVINYGSGSGSDFLPSYGSGSGSTSQKVTVPTVPVPVPVPQHCYKVLFQSSWRYRRPIYWNIRVIFIIIFPLSSAAASYHIPQLIFSQFLLAILKSKQFLSLKFMALTFAILQ